MVVAVTNPFDSNDFGRFIIVDKDPSTDSGVSGAIGARAVLSDASIVFLKYGTGDTDWHPLNAPSQMWVWAADGRPLNGTWTPSQSGSNNHTIMYHASTGTEQVYILPIPTYNLIASDGCLKLHGYKTVYRVEGADADDVLCVLKASTVPTDGNLMAAGTTYGTADADYDENHNLASERGYSNTGAGVYHVATVTLGGGTPAPLALSADTVLCHEFRFDGDAGTTAKTRFFGVQLIFREDLL